MGRRQLPTLCGSVEHCPSRPPRTRSAECTALLHAWRFCGKLSEILLCQLQTPQRPPGSHLEAPVIRVSATTSTDGAAYVKQAALPPHPSRLAPPLFSALYLSTSSLPAPSLDPLATSSHHSLAAQRLRAWAHRSSCTLLLVHYASRLDPLQGLVGRLLRLRQGQWTSPARRPSSRRAGRRLPGRLLYYDTFNGV